MASSYDTILREALELHPVDRARLVEELARSLAAEAGVDSESLLTAETARRLDENLNEAKELEDARIQAAIDEALKRRGSAD